MIRSLSCVAVLALAGSAFGQITPVPYASLTGTGFEGFEGFAAASGAGVNYDAVVGNSNVSFAERFAGQTLGVSGDFDTLSGSPTGPLSLVVGAPDQNLSLLISGGSNVITGLGPLGYPSFGAVGEGALSFLFDVDQGEFGFQLVGGDGGSADVSFFRRDGSLISTIAVSGLASAFYGFQRDGGLTDIAGVSITNTDGAGIGLDNLRFTIPAPGSLALLGLGALAAGRRRR
jgi:hypothetical protein